MYKYIYKLLCSMFIDCKYLGIQTPNKILLSPYSDVLLNNSSYIITLVAWLFWFGQKPRLNYACLGSRTKKYYNEKGKKTIVQTL